VEAIPEFLEVFAIDDMLRLLAEESEKSAAAKEARAKLGAKTVAQYAKLTDEEVKALVVEDKWIASIEAAINGERDRIAQALTGRIKTLVERYAEPLPVLAKKVEELDARVAGHLSAMGFVFQ
jgi:type I restriction enzyme M protein